MSIQVLKKYSGFFLCKRNFDSIKFFTFRVLKRKICRIIFNGKQGISKTLVIKMEPNHNITDLSKITTNLNAQRAS